MSICSESWGKLMHYRMTLKMFIAFKFAFLLNISAYKCQEAGALVLWPDSKFCKPQFLMEPTLLPKLCSQHSLGNYSNDKIMVKHWTAHGVHTWAGLTHHAAPLLHQSPTLNAACEGKRNELLNLAKVLQKNSKDYKCVFETVFRVL